MGRKCYECRKDSVGYCPFGNACRREVWELYPMPSRAGLFLDYLKERREALKAVKTIRHEAVRFGEVK